MKKIDQLLAKYNNINNYIIVSEFPSEKQLKGNTGLSRYSHNTIMSLKETLGRNQRKAIVLSMVANGSEDKIYEYNDMLIIRCLKRNSIPSLLRLIYYANRLHRVEKVLFEFEFAAYGNEKISLAIPFVLSVLAMFGKKTHFAMHQVVTNLKSLYIHLGLKKGSFRLLLIEQALQLFYRAVGLLSHKVIVLEDEFKQRLSSFVSAKKIAVIPHGIEAIQGKIRYTKEDVGYKNSDFIILLFGYISWYKGIDDVIHVFNKLPATINGRKLKLVIAGGKSVAQKGKKHYEQYYTKIEKLASKNKNIVITGFVKEEDIAKYYRAADLCIVPYKTFMSSSGPLSLAVSFQKPFVMSDKLSGYVKSEDFSEAIRQSGIVKDDLFLPIQVKDLYRAITNVMSNKSYGVKVKRFAKSLLRKRSWSMLSKSYADELFSGSTTAKRETYFGYLTSYRTYASIIDTFKSR